MKKTESTSTEITSTELVNNELPIAEVLFSVPAEHPCYADHFPGDPLVPGALLLKWILAQIEIHHGCKVLTLKSIKFLAPVKPGDYLKIIMNNHPNKMQLSFMQLSFDIFVLDKLVMKGSIEYDNGMHVHRDQA